MKKVHRSNAIDYRFLPFPSLIIDSRESRLLPVSIAFSIRSADEFRINSVIIILSEKIIGRRRSKVYLVRCFRWLERNHDSHSLINPMQFPASRNFSNRRKKKKEGGF